MRCLLCFSAVNGKELSSCLSEIFPFFLPTACTGSLGSSLHRCLQQLVCHTQWRENRGDSTGCSEHIPQENRGTEDFRWFFFFLAENTDLEDTAGSHWFQQTVSDPTKQLDLNQFWKTEKYLDILWNEISVVVYCLRGHLISMFLLCFCFLFYFH